MTLTEFLLARIGEDEAVARASSGTGRVWGSNGGTAVRSVSLKERPIAKAMNMRIGAHIARHDPARVLAECEAKRRIVKDCQHLADIGPGALAARAEWVCRSLALPYAEHPDYRDEWAT